jgi:nitrate reductase molybdenum cofactor assembly chaperone NarJ/NarW
VTLLGIVSRLLLYPEAPPDGEGSADKHVAAYLAAMQGVPLQKLRDDYVATFDFDKRTNLYLTYHLHGDGRRRGVELVRLKRRFREAGLELAEGELPDYLPVLLEFAELAPEPGMRVLAELRGSLELVRSALHDRGSPYAHLLDAVARALPSLTHRQRAEVERLALDGPPTELVGLDSFTPPELEPFLAGRANA